MSVSNGVFINTKDKLCQFELNRELFRLVSSTNKIYQKIAVVAIGSDRSTGDSFGPLVGHMLSKYSIFDYDVYGTIHEPVHALNIVETVSKIDTNNTLIIAVDASIGDFSHVGHIGLSDKPIKPGSGVGKDLPPVGDISLTGIVSIAGIGGLSNILLQTTSLGMVYKMAEITSKSILNILYKLQRNKGTVRAFH
ncbi:MAG: spore protease YyaC [Clostridiaceae bacterium]|nr:spore protease YyaC [Clostridiaceae bacterium]